MKKEDSVADAAAPAKRTLVWPLVAVMLGFGLLYAYDLFEAIADLFGVTAHVASYNDLAAQAGLSAITVPWLPLVINLVLPIVVFVIAFLIARRRPLLVGVLVFATGLAVVAAVSLSMNVLGGLLSSAAV